MGLTFEEKTEVNDELRWEVHLICSENIRPDKLETRLRGDRDRVRFLVYWRTSA